MTSTNLNMKLNARKISKQVNMTVHIKLKNVWLIYVGLFFIRVGAWIANFDIKLEDE